MLIEGETTRLEGQAINLASDLAYSLIREAMSKKFDEDAVTTYYQYASEFTPTSKLGPSSSEVISPLPDRTPYKSLPRFDDFDDYNGYERVADTPTIKGFLIKSKVYYVV
jgi:hypothetical protein